MSSARRLPFDRAGFCHDTVTELFHHFGGHHQEQRFVFNEPEEPGRSQ
jgi:hypothetical protein